MRSAILSGAVAAAVLVAGCGEEAPRGPERAGAPATVSAATTTPAAVTAAPEAAATTPATETAPAPSHASPPDATETVTAPPASSAPPAQDPSQPKPPGAGDAPTAADIRAQVQRANRADAARTRKAGRAAFGHRASPAQERAVRAVFDRAVTAVRAGDWPAACARLLPAMREQYVTPSGEDDCAATVRRYVEQRGTTNFALRDLRVKGENATGLNARGVTVVFVRQKGRWYLASPL